jgi:outer membrane protein
MGGIPPRPAIIGGGTVASLGKLGAVDFGPVILSGIYRLPERLRIRPYIGAGVAHVFILGNHDATVTRLKVHDNWGFVLQAGFEFRLNRSWGLFVDYKRLWLFLNAEGLLAKAPVRARETLDPDLVSVGLKFHFH